MLRSATKSASCRRRSRTSRAGMPPEPQRSLPDGAQDRPAHQHRQHVVAPFRIDADVRERLALLVRAAAQLLREPRVGGLAEQIVESLDERGPGSERAHAQPDGSERATEIHIFPEALRGLGEGSRMMTQSTGGSGSRMTNGAVSGSRMTNGTASPSRMSNGNVASANGSSLDVQFAGGSTHVNVPPNTPVTEIKSASKALAAGDQIVVLAKRGANGSLSASGALLTRK